MINIDINSNSNTQNTIDNNINCIDNIKNSQLKSILSKTYNMNTNS